MAYNGCLQDIIVLSAIECVIAFCRTFVWVPLVQLMLYKLVKDTTNHLKHTDNIKKII